MALPEISEQELLFVQEYVRDRNKVRAGLAAKLSPTYQGASKAAQALLQNPPIKAWVKSLLSRQAKALKFKPSKVLHAWMMASNVDLTYFEVDKDGKLTTAPGVPREYLRCVRKVKQTKTERLNGENQLVSEVRTEIELRDPFGPECKLMEHYGELKDETANGPGPLDLLGRLAAAAVAQQSARQRGGAGADPGAGGPPVAPEAAAGGGVPE